MTNHPPYIEARKTPAGYRGTIVLNGERRWVREHRFADQVAAQLLACHFVDHVITDDGRIEDTGALSLGECIEAVCWQPS
jgi:hypothetical protein